MDLKSDMLKSLTDFEIKNFDNTNSGIFILISVYLIINNFLEISSFLIIFLYKNKVLDLINYISEIRKKLAEEKVSEQRVFDIITYNSFKKEIETMLEKMKEIIAEQLSVDADSITEASSFKDDLGADSLDLFELVMALEDEYSVEIPAEDLQNLATVGDVMNYLKEKGVEA